MTAETDLLPLPPPGMLHTNEPRLWFTAAQLQAYARANLAQLQAENARLRREVSALETCAVKYLGWLGIKAAAAVLHGDMADPEMCGDAALAQEDRND